MKKSKQLKLIILTILLISTLCTNSIIVKASTLQDKLNITTGDSILGKIYYDNFSIIAKKITSPLGIGYCLEIDKPYPNGELFTNIGEVNTSVKNIFSCGYPEKSASELNLNSDDDAYFATQIAIWSSIEGYNVNNIRSDRPEILEAIKLIYNNALNSANNVSKYNVSIYSTNKTIQNVLVLSLANSSIPILPLVPTVPSIPDELPPPVIDDAPIYNGK